MSPCLLSNFEILRGVNDLHRISQRVMRTSRIFVNHSDVRLLRLQEIVDHFTLTITVPPFEPELATLAQKDDDVFVGIALERKGERHATTKSSRLKKTLAPNSTTLDTSSEERSLVRVVPSSSR